MSDQIKAIDVFDPLIFDTAKALKYLETIELVELGLKELLGTSKQIMVSTPFKDSKDIASYTKQLSESLVLEKKIVQVTGEKIKASTALETLEQKKIQTANARIKQEQILNKVADDAVKQAAKLTKEYEKSNSVYQQTVKRLSEVKKELKDFVVLQDRGVKLNYEQRKSLTALEKEFVILDKTVTKAEHSVKEFQRNVGNYPKTLTELKFALKEAKNEMVAVAAASGMGSKEFAEAAKKAGALKDTINDVNDATKQMATGGGLGQFKNQLKGVGESLMDLDFKEAAERAAALGVTAKSLNFKDLISGAKNAAIAMYRMAAAFLLTPFGMVAAGIALISAGLYLMVKASRDSTAAMISDIDSLDNSYKRFYNRRIALAKAWGEDTAKIELKAMEKEAELIQERIHLLEKVAKTTFRLSDEETKNLQELYDKRRALDLEVEVKKIEIFLAGAKKRKEKREEEAAEATAAAEKAAEKAKKVAVKKLADAKTLRDAETANITNNYDRQRAELTNKFNDDFEQYKSNSKIISELKTKLDSDLKSIDEKEKQDKLDAEQKHQDELIRLRRVQFEHDAKLKLDAEKVNQAHLDKLQKAHVESEAKLKAQKDKEAKEDKERLQSTFDFADSIGKIKTQNEEKILNAELEMRQRNILQQQQLAMSGRDNTLAFEKEAAAKAELAKIELARKEERRLKAMAFLKLLSAYADKGDADGAVSKTLIQMAIAGAIIGSYKEGVEGIDGDGTETSDSILARLSKNESVITAKGTRDNSGLATAMNKGKVEEYFEDKYLPKYLTENGVGGFAENAFNSILIQQFATMNSKIANIEKALKERPVSTVNLNNLGEVIDTKIINGFHKQTLRKSNSPLNYI